MQIAVENVVVHLLCVLGELEKKLYPKEKCSHTTATGRYMEAAASVESHLYNLFVRGQVQAVTVSEAGIYLTHASM